MSLFKAKEWWRTQCGDSQTECFDGQSLLIARQLFGQESPTEVIVVASQAGYLRIYAPTNQWDDELGAPEPYKSTDLVIEAKLAHCILDVKAGRFVSGSQDTRLAILTPTKLIVYTTSLIKGSAEHGDRCSLKVAYEHQLQRFPASLTIGPFGAVRGRDFLCVQCLDGTLLFYEQEVYSFSRVFKARLLPEPLIYIARNDVFVTLGSGWHLECYRYQNIAEVGRKEEAEGTDVAKGITPDWSYNIGEPILGINSVVLSSFEVGVVVLGERTLYCLGDACTSIKTAKRLEYSALCFLSYVIEPDGKLMVIVVADTSTLMIYEGTTLKWSAQLPFAPVAVARAHLQNLEGAIVILSEDGRLEVCYLGSEPSLFVAPPIHRRGFDYVAAERELLELRRLLKKSASSDWASGAQVTSAMKESELTINPAISPELLPSPFGAARAESGEDKEGRQFSMCKVFVELTSYTTLQDVQVFLEASKPLHISNDCLHLSNLCEKYTMETLVYVDGESPAHSSELSITATYANESGKLRVVRRSVQLPLKMLLRPCPPETSGPFSVTIKSAEPVLNFSQIFPEFVGEYTSRQVTNSLGLQHAQTAEVVSMASGLMLNRYRLQAADGSAVPLVLNQLISRLRDKAPAAAEKITCSITQQHLQLAQSNIDAHFSARLKIRAALKEIGLLTTQLRNIEKRMLRGTRERNSRSLAATGLPTLLDSTYRAIFALLDDLQAARAERERTGHNLKCSLRLLLLLLQLNAGADKCALLEAAIGFEPQLRDEVDWEEVTDMGLIGLMRSVARAGGAESRQLTAWNRFETGRDLAKLKKRLAHALERLSSGASIKESPAEETAAATESAG